MKTLQLVFQTDITRVLVYIDGERSVYNDFEEAIFALSGEEYEVLRPIKLLTGAERFRHTIGKDDANISFIQKLHKKMLSYKITEIEEDLEEKRKKLNYLRAL